MIIPKDGILSTSICQVKPFEAAILRGNGNANIVVLDGGVLAWEAAGLLEAIEP